MLHKYVYDRNVPSTSFLHGVLQFSTDMDFEYEQFNYLFSYQDLRGDKICYIVMTSNDLFLKT